MRILDAQYDFYDFYQNVYRDNHFTFDRRDSFPLTKKAIMEAINVRESNTLRDTRIPLFLLLQVGIHYWLLKLINTKIEDRGYGAHLKDFDLEVVADNWINPSRPVKSIEISFVKFPWWIYSDFKAKDMVDCINNNQHKVKCVFNKHLIWKDGDATHQERHIPLLKETGIPEVIAPLDIYLALEEYLSMQVDASERRESIDLTNNDKVTNHGFDLKTSFRGKEKK